MTGTIGAMLTVFGLGVAYFIAAIPAGVALHLSPVTSAVCAWAGYTAIGAAMLIVGAPARKWLSQKLKLSDEPDETKLFWRIWKKGGLIGLSFLAPVTCGPYFAALIALALGEKPRRLIFWIAVGAIPWCILFASLAAAGSTLLPKP